MNRKGKAGSSNPHWKGGRTHTESGYVMIRKPSHPNARSSGYVLEHRYVMSTHLGRALGETEIVHHLNGIITDNRIENLELLTREIHGHLHQPSGSSNPQWKERSPKKCERCGVEFVATHQNHKRNKYCSRKCTNTFGEQALRAILSDEHVAAIRSIGAGMSQQKLAALFGISKAQIGRILRNQSRNQPSI